MRIKSFFEDSDGQYLKMVLCQLHLCTRVLSVEGFWPLCTRVLVIKTFKGQNSVRRLKMVDWQLETLIRVAVSARLLRYKFICVLKLY